jgi:hypothetical protein
MVNVSRKINSRSVTIDAPVMMVQQGDGVDEPVWMERNFFPNLLDLIKEYNISLKGIEIKQGKIKISFKDYKHATKFRLVYESKNNK